MANADDVYLKSREDLLQYEDARFLSLIQAMANFYPTRNDQSVWGAFLRAVAMELARLEFAYTYDIVAKNPDFLTPADIKRRYSDPLEINRNYPQSSQFDSGEFTTATPSLQYPMGYKDMVVGLIKAYTEGAVASSMADVIYAYTGKNIPIEEFYKDIPTKGVGATSIYDASYRNTVGVRVQVGGTNTFQDIQNLRQLQQVITSLYGALDLAKPAHVGLEFATLFGADESVKTNILAISDTLRLIVQNVENSQFDPMLYKAPLVELRPNGTPKHPATTIAAWGLKMKPSLSTADFNALPPKPVTLTDKSPSLSQAYHFDSTQGLYVLGFTPWAPTTTFVAGQLLLDTAGNLQVVQTGGVSGSYGTITVGTRTKDGVVIDAGTSVPQQPTWSTTTTTDGTVVWTCLGTNYLVDMAKWIMVVDNTGVPTGEVSNWDKSHPMGLLAPRLNKVWEIKGDVFSGNIY